MTQMRNRKPSVEDVLEFLLERNIVAEKNSGVGYIYEYHENTFRYWSKNEAVTELSKYMGYGQRSKAGRRLVDNCTEEYCIEWPSLGRHWEENMYTKLDLMEEISGVDLSRITNKTYHELSSYHNRLKKKIPDDAKFREEFSKYVLRKLKEDRDLRYRK